MLAKENDQPFSDENWLFEIKWDGYRAIAEKEGQNIQLYSRNGLNFFQTYPIIGHQLFKLQNDVVIDGEIIVLDDKGEPDFQMLQHYSENNHRPIQYQVFDLLSLDGQDTTQLTLIERKELLKKVLPENEVLRYSDHIVNEGLEFYKITEEKGLEGMLAKKMDSLYFPGKRTSDWLKIKHHKTMEAIIVGFTEPTGSRKYFGALVLALKKGNHYIYAGNTGTGFGLNTLKELYSLLQPLVVNKAPFTAKIKTNTPVTWVEPELVCEIKFAEITKDEKFRHPVFMHLRRDKDKNEVNMNQKATSVKKSSSETKSAKITRSGESSNKKKKITSAKNEKRFTGKVSKDGQDMEYTFGENKVLVTHYEKVYFPEDGITKGEVAEYYISMADYILPHLKGRPESLLRNPNGIHAKGFFHKDAAENVPSFINKVIVHSESNDKEIDYIVCDNLATLVYMNNLGCIEINPWPATVKNLENPDYLIIDIDPSEKNTFDQVVEVALTVKNILDRAGASSFCKTSGATGLHVYVPAGKKYSFAQVKDFALIICTLVQDQLKDFTTLERSLSKRSNKKIYLDYLQNRRGQTLASAYSLRPKVGATVSTPLLWEEVKKGLSPKQFTLHTIKDRVDKMGDLFSYTLGKGLDIKKCLEKLGG